MTTLDVSSLSPTMYSILSISWTSLVTICNILLIMFPFYIIFFLILLIVFVTDSSYYDSCSSLLDFSMVFLFTLPSTLILTLIWGLISNVMFHNSKVFWFPFGLGVFVLFICMVWYAVDIGDTSSCGDLGKLLLANNIILYSYFLF